MPPADPAVRSNVNWSIALPNNLGGLKDGLNGLDTWLQSHRVDTETENRARLVFDEIVTNVIRHAHGDDKSHLIHADLRLSGGALTLSFRDDGRPFDPRSVEGRFYPELQCQCRRADRAGQRSFRTDLNGRHGSLGHR